MQTLPTELRVQNRSLKQLKRQGQVALYEVHGPQGLLYGFEVIVIRIRKEHEAFGKVFPEMETYPANEQWGTHGFSYQARDLAGTQKKFGDLLPKWAGKPCTSRK